MGDKIRFKLWVQISYKELSKITRSPVDIFEPLLSERANTQDVGNQLIGEGQTLHDNL